MLNIKSATVLCEGCRAAESAVYCRSDSAYLCVNCDSRIHAGAHHHHERVWLCTSCANAPAAFLCKADSASLCIDCDSNIHSANPLAGRHHRVPIQPIRDGVNSSLAPNFTGSTIPENSDGDEDDDEEAASWLLLNPLNGRGHNEEGPHYSEFLDLPDFGPSPNFDEQGSHPEDYSVPNRHCFRFGLEDDSQKRAHFFSPSSFYQTTGLVPDTTTQVSISQIKQDNVASDPLSSCAMDREARVLRYREKKKNRRFEKTIRYASRKAYAEVRPRIKGRFAKQADRRVQVCFSDRL